MTKYKYYLRKPKSEIVKDIVYWLSVSGMVCVAATSPYFGVNLVRVMKRRKKYSQRKVGEAFKILQRRGCVGVKTIKGQVYIYLTEEGKKIAGWKQIDALKIKKPKRWDKKWRLVIFDISQLRKFYREAFRGKLKELGFYPLQKSVWIFPFDCYDEIELLRDFFGLTEKEMRLIISEDIGKDEKLKDHFKIS